MLQSEEIFGDSNAYAIDEKCATSYIKTDLNQENMPTFAFELDYKGKSGTRNAGWLFGNQYSKTDYYLITWLWADINESEEKKENLKKHVTESNITKVKAILINKEKIRAFITSYGINIQNYMRASKKLREEKDELYINLNQEGNKKTPKIQYTTNLYEKPVNIIVSEYDLKKLADKVWDDVR